MRIAMICLLLLVAPALAVISVKQYQAAQLKEQRRIADFPSRGEVLFFNASWCGPCRQMKPIVTQMRRQGYRMRDIDVDRHRDLAQQYGIRAVPTFVFVENGTEITRFSGGASPEKLRKLCSNPLYR
jgi:thioredoxin-like negative regulator of GroEL